MNKIRFGILSSGALLTWLFGRWEIGIQILITVIVLDYFTGIAYAIVTKKLSSQIGFKGFCKKCFILVVLILAVQLDKLLGLKDIWRTLVIYYYVSVEALSIFENMVNLGLPVPSSITDAFIQIKNNANEGENKKGDN